MNILRIVIPALFFKLGMAATRWPDKPQARGIWDVLPTFRLWLVESCEWFCSPWVLWRETDEGQVGHARHCFPVVALSPFKKGGKKNKKIKRVELGEGPTWTTPGHPLIPEYYITGSAFLAWVPSSGWGIMILYTYPSSSSSWQVALVTVLLPVPHLPLLTEPWYGSDGGKPLSFLLHPRPRWLLLARQSFVLNHKASSLSCPQLWPGVCISLLVISGNPLPWNISHWLLSPAQSIPQDSRKPWGVVCGCWRTIFLADILRKPAEISGMELSLCQAQSQPHLPGGSRGSSPP